MINLLPPDVKKSYRYARANVTLRKWVIMFAFAFVGLIALTTFGLLTMQQSSNKYEKSIAQSQAQFEKEKYSEIQKRVEEISSSFKLVKTVLSQEILFSKLIQQIGTAIPKNAILSGLTISQTQGALDITANATDYATATQVQVNLADPSNKIFTKADIINISCSDKTDANGQTNKYPCTVTIRALFGDNSSYLFINNEDKKQ